jgi:RNA polymerase sigma-70 factor (ECF subfamily)
MQGIILERTAFCTVHLAGSARLNRLGMSDTVERLCRLASAGDVQAGSELLSRSYERIFAYFRRLCVEESDAADLTQKTFIKVWASLPTYEARASFNTWLHAIARHVYLDWRRKPRRNEAQTEAWWNLQPSAGQGPLESTEERDLAQKLYASVESLDEGARELIHLHYYQGLSLFETAEVLGIAVSTVKYRLRAAFDALRRSFRKGNHE